MSSASLVWCLGAGLAALALAQTTAAQTTAAQTAAAQTDAARAAAEGKLVHALTDHYLGNDSAAVQGLDAVLELRPGDGAALDALAEVYSALGRPTDALYHAMLATEAAPAEASVHTRLGALQAAAGQPAAALAQFEMARRLDPADAETLVAIADLHAAAGRADAEREALEALVAVGPTPAAYLRLSVLYTQAGDAARATDALRHGVRLAPADPTLRARLAAATGQAEPAPPRSSGTPSPAAMSADEALAVVAQDPRRLDAWAVALAALATAGDARAADTADEATLLFPTVPSVLAPAAEAYLAAGRFADAARASRTGLAALEAATAPEDDPAATSALRARLERALAASSR